MTYLLALDASSTAVGWAEFHDDKCEASGVFIPISGVFVPAGDNWQRRVKVIWAWLHDYIGEFGFDVLAYEIASGDRHNMKTNRILGAVEWACWSAADRWDVRWLPVNVQQVKASGCHKNAVGNAEAVTGHKMDAKHPGDEADAIGVALAALRILREEALRTETTEWSVSCKTY